jgi:hypothetical protein
MITLTVFVIAECQGLVVFSKWPVFPVEGKARKRASLQIVNHAIRRCARYNRYGKPFSFPVTSPEARTLVEQATQSSVLLF